MKPLNTEEELVEMYRNGTDAQKSFAKLMLEKWYGLEEDITDKDNGDPTGEGSINQ